MSVNAAAKPLGTDELLTAHKALIDRLDELIHLTRLGRLEDGHILRFLHNDQEIRLSLPYAERDYIQRNVVRTGTFYEIRQLELLRQSGLVPENATILDVGANIGNHTVFFAKAFRPVRLICVEPQDTARRVLAVNIDLNGLPGVTILDCLLGSADGYGEAADFRRGNLGGTSFRECGEGGLSMRTLDSVLEKEALGNADFVKIDVEGMHLEVLAGATRLLRDVRPVVWIELRAQKKEYDPAVEIFARFGYREKLRLGPNDFVFAGA